MTTTVRAPDPCTGEGLQEPLSRDLERRLRAAVLRHVTSEPRRRHPTVLHVGEPGGPELLFACAEDDPDDQGVRTDVVVALLARCPRPDPLVWITRPGGLETQDDDARWLAATRAAGGELGRHVQLVLVSRRGWRDPRSGTTRTWRRLRDRRTAGTPR